MVKGGPVTIEIIESNKLGGILGNITKDHFVYNGISRRSMCNSIPSGEKACGVCNKVI